MRKTVGFIVVDEYTNPLGADARGVLWTCTKTYAATLFPSRDEAQKAIKRSAEYASRMGFAEVWRVHCWGIRKMATPHAPRKLPFSRSGEPLLEALSGKLAAKEAKGRR